MTTTPWTAAALLARLNVVTALDAAPSPPTPTRAQIRLELVGIVTAVDNTRIDADDAVALLQALQARILHSMNADLDQTTPAR